MSDIIWKALSVILSILAAGGVLLFVGGALYMHDREKILGEVHHAKG